MAKISLSSNVIRKLFQNVFFINGTAYAGKSTMIKMLSEKYNGVCCGENYNEKLFYLMDPVHQPNLCYFQTMSDWPDLEKQFLYQRIMEADEEFPRLFGKTFYAIIRY